MRAYEEHVMSLRIARHKPVDVVDEKALPAPTKFKKEKSGIEGVWKIGRSYSAPASNDSSDYSKRPEMKIEVTENIFIKAVILVRIFFECIYRRDSYLTCICLHLSFEQAGQSSYVNSRRCCGSCQACFQQANTLPAVSS